MSRHIIAGVLLLGLVGVTIALAQQGGQPAKVPPAAVGPAPEPTRAVVNAEKPKLFACVARLRAEVELLQLEHDVLKAAVSDRLKGIGKATVTEGLTQEIDDAKVAEYYMKRGAELVGKGAEFDTAIEQDRAAVEEAIAKAREALTERKHEYLRVTTELNQKKIELMELETRLDSSL
jgi:hypothetical protein